MNEQAQSTSAIETKPLTLSEYESLPLFERIDHVDRVYREDSAEPDVGYRIKERLNTSTYIDDWGNVGIVDQNLTGEFWCSAKEFTSYKNGKLHGRQILFDDNKSPRFEMLWSNGERHGVWTNRYENGSILSVTQHENGLMNGSYTLYYNNEQKETEGNHVDDNREGLWTNWNDSGQKILEEEFQNGELVNSRDFSAESEGE